MDLEIVEFEWENVVFDELMKSIYLSVTRYVILQIIGILNRNRSIHGNYIESEEIRKLRAFVFVQPLFFFKNSSKIIRGGRGKSPHLVSRFC